MSQPLQGIVQSLQGVSADDVIYFLNSDGTNATLCKATCTSTTPTLEKISTLSGVNLAQLGKVLTYNLDGFTHVWTVDVSGDTLTVAGRADAAVDVELNASGITSMQVGGAWSPSTGDPNAGIQNVDVSNLIGQDAEIKPTLSEGPLRISVIGQTGPETTTVTGSDGNDSISVISGNVNVYAGTGDDTVSVDAGYEGTVELGTGTDTLEVSGKLGSATFIGTSSTAKSRQAKLKAVN